MMIWLSVGGCAAVVVAINGWKMPDHDRSGLDAGQTNRAAIFAGFAGGRLFVRR
jgi:hypothetical protein